MRVSILFLIFLGTSSVAANEALCGKGASQRRLTGPAPITGKLHVVAERIDGLLFRRGEFDDEQFTYIGLVKARPGTSWHVVYLSTTWGGSCRATTRLLVFSDDMRFVGQYSHFSARPLGTEGDTVFFDSPADQGDRITFTADGPPKKAWFDGENFELYR